MCAVEQTSPPYLAAFQSRAGELGPDLPQGTQGMAAKGFLIPTAPVVTP